MPKPATTNTPRQLNCLRCGYTWTTRREKDPTVCPSCTSRYWDQEPRRGAYPRGADHWRSRNKKKD